MRIRTQAATQTRVVQRLLVHALQALGACIAGEYKVLPLETEQDVEHVLR